MSADMYRYLVWGSVVVLGAVFAVVDRRWIGRRMLLALLVLIALGGLATTQLSPFNFHSGGWYMQGVLVAGGAALALLGYAPIWLWHVVRGRT